MIGIVADVQFTGEYFHIHLDQEQYEEFLECIRGVEASETDEEDFEQENVPRVRRTSSGRTLRFPDRFIEGTAISLKVSLPSPLGEVEKLLLQAILQFQHRTDYRSYTHNLSSFINIFFINK